MRGGRERKKLEKGMGGKEKKVKDSDEDWKKSKLLRRRKLPLH